MLKFLRYLLRITINIQIIFIIIKTNSIIVAIVILTIKINIRKSIIDIEIILILNNLTIIFVIFITNANIFDIDLTIKLFISIVKIIADISEIKVDRLIRRISFGFWKEICRLCICLHTWPIKVFRIFLKRLLHIIIFKLQIIQLIKQYLFL